MERQSVKSKDRTRGRLLRERANFPVLLRALNENERSLNHSVRIAITYSE